MNGNILIDNKHLIYVAIVAILFLVSILLSWCTYNEDFGEKITEKMHIIFSIMQKFFIIVLLLILLVGLITYTYRLAALSCVITFVLFFALSSIYEKLGI